MLLDATFKFKYYKNIDLLMNNFPLELLIIFSTYYDLNMYI